MPTNEIDNIPSLQSIKVFDICTAEGCKEQLKCNKYKEGDVSFQSLENSQNVIWECKYSHRLRDGEGTFKKINLCTWKEQED